MRKTIVLLLAVTAQAIGTASAQQSLRPGTPHMFSWSPEQQAEWYPAIETVYRSATIKRGDYVHPLPKADRTLTVSYRGRTTTATVVDRGPFVGNREFDLTAATAKAIGFKDVGKVWVSR